MRAMLDSFSGALADLPKRKRDTVSALRVLDKHPRVSVWDLSEHGWLGDLVTDLLLAGLIEDDKRVPYPWHHFTLTDAGRGKLAANVGGEARLAAHQPSQATTATPQGVASTDQLGGRFRSEKD